MSWRLRGWGSGAGVLNPSYTRPAFIETSKPTDDDIKTLTETVAERVIRLLVRRGVLDETAGTVDPLTEEEPVLAGLLQASVLGGMTESCVWS